jgi:YceI-like domain
LIFVLAGTWELDPVHSSIGFEVPYLSGTFKGQFREAKAKLVVRDGKADLDGSAVVASVDVKDENLSAHLQSPGLLRRRAPLRAALQGAGHRSPGRDGLRERRTHDQGRDEAGRGDRDAHSADG